MNQLPSKNTQQTILDEHQESFHLCDACTSRFYLLPLIHLFSRFTPSFWCHPQQQMHTNKPSSGIGTMQIHAKYTLPS